MAQVDYETLPVEKRALHSAPLDEIAKVLNEGMKNNFSSVTVTVVDCPNLQEEPFTLARSGLGGKPKLLDIGGPAFLLPLPQKEKLYDLREVNKIMNVEAAFIIGAGAGPHPYPKTNCEGIFNLYLGNGVVDQQTRISKIDPQDESHPVQDTVPSTELRLALLGNLYYSEGKQGRVLKVSAKQRTGNQDFITNIRTTLANYYKDKPVGLGGAFLLKEGKAKQHVMRNFSQTPINNEKELNEWLTFYDMSAPLIAVGTLTTADMGLDLRLQHFHSFSYHNEAGHYHNDVTPDTVEYLGYFNVAEEIYRIDRPPSALVFGKD